MHSHGLRKKLIQIKTHKNQCNTHKHIKNPSNPLQNQYTSTPTNTHKHPLKTNEQPIKTHPNPFQKPMSTLSKPIKTNWNQSKPFQKHVTPTKNPSTPIKFNQHLSKPIQNQRKTNIILDANRKQHSVPSFASSKHTKPEQYIFMRGWIFYVHVRCEYIRLYVHSHALRTNEQCTVTV